MKYRCPNGHEFSDYGDGFCPECDMELEEVPVASETPIPASEGSKPSSSSPTEPPEPAEKERHCLRCGARYMENNPIEWESGVCSVCDGNLSPLEKDSELETRRSGNTQLGRTSPLAHNESASDDFEGRLAEVLGASHSGDVGAVTCYQGEKPQGDAINLVMFKSGTPFRTYSSTADRILIGRHSKTKMIFPEIDLTEFESAQKQVVVSREHAFVLKRSGGVYLRKAGRGKIHINNQPLEENREVEIDNGDEIVIGRRYLFKLVLV